MEANIETELTKHYWLYALKLEDDKYYVGITTKADPGSRIKMHGGFYGAKWTHKHKPVETLETRELGFVTETEAARQEQVLTLDYMKRYGYKNVRGGTLSYSGNYTKLGDRYFTEEQWYAFRAVSILTFLMLLTLIAILFQKFSD
ncbi:MAG TPA: GIY-YIG nuclease family protein [Candidatus Saccharimonadales bacterium]